jgi:hypothetical protein
MGLIGKILGKGSGKVIKEATKDMGMTGKLLKPVLRFITGNRFTRWFGNKLIIKPVATISRKLGFGKFADKLLAYAAKGSLGGLMLSGVAGMGAIAMLKKFFGMGKTKDSPNADGSIPESAKPDPAEDNKLDKDLNTEDNLEKFNRLSSERKLAESNRKLQELKVEIDKAKVNREKALSQRIDANDPSQVENKFSQVSAANAQVTDAVNKRLEIIDERLQQNKKAIDQANENIVKINKSLSEKLKGVYKSLKDKLTVKKDGAKGGILAWIGKTLGTLWNVLKSIAGILAISAGAAVVKGRDKLVQGWKSLTSGVKDFFGYSDKDSVPKSSEKSSIEEEKSPDPKTPEVTEEDKSNVDKNSSQEKVTDDKQPSKENPNDPKESPKPEEKVEKKKEPYEGPGLLTSIGSWFTAKKLQTARNTRKAAETVAKSNAEKLAKAAEHFEYKDGQWMNKHTGRAAKPGALTSFGLDPTKGPEQLSTKVKPKGFWGKLESGLSKVWNKTGGKLVKKVKAAGSWIVKKVLGSKVGRKLLGGLTKKIGAILGKSAAKSLLKRIPIMGALMGIGFAIPRAMRGDWLGAAGEVASGALSLMGPLGLVAGTGLDVALGARDAVKAKEEYENSGEFKDSDFKVNDQGGLDVSDDAINPEKKISKVDTKIPTTNRIQVLKSSSIASKSQQGGFVAKQDTTKPNPQKNLSPTKKIPVKVNKSNESDYEKLDKKLNQLGTLVATLSEENRSLYNATTSRAWTITGRKGDLTGTSM